MDTEYKYHAFVSYSHADNSGTDGYRWGDWVHEALENFVVPESLIGVPGRYGAVPARVFPVFQDEKELPTSAALDTALHDALTASKVLIVLCSPNSARSRWVNQEIVDFKRMGRADRILAVILDGEPNATDSVEARDEVLATGGSAVTDDFLATDRPTTSRHGHAGADHECFPPALRFAVDVDGRIDRSRPVEPIAADLRGARAAHGAEQKRLLDRERTRIAAGVLGVGFDDLVQRDKERQLAAERARTARLRRLAVAFAALSIVAVCGGVLAYLNQRKAENAERATADTLSWSQFYRAVDFHQDGARAAALAALAQAVRVSPGNTAAGRKLAYLLAEGDYYVEVDDGHPGAAAARTGAALPVAPRRRWAGRQPWRFEAGRNGALAVTVESTGITAAEKRGAYLATRIFSPAAIAARHAVLSDDGRVLATAGGVSGEFGSAGGVQIFKLSNDPESRHFHQVLDSGLDQPVTELDVSADGQLVGVRAGALIRVYRIDVGDAGSGRRVWEHTADADGAFSGFFANGRGLRIAESIWYAVAPRMQTQSLAGLLPGDGVEGLDVAFSADARYFALRSHAEGSAAWRYFHAATHAPIAVPPFTATPTTPASGPSAGAFATGVRGASSTSVRMQAASGDTLWTRAGLDGQDLSVQMVQSGEVVLAATSNSGLNAGLLYIIDAVSGIDLARPVHAGGNLFVRPDGRRVFTDHELDGPLAHDLLGDEAPVPGWLAELGEAVGGLRLDERGVLQPLATRQRLATIARVAAGLDADSNVPVHPDGNGWFDFGRWFVLGPDTPLPSPYSAAQQ